MGNDLVVIDQYSNLNRFNEQMIAIGEKKDYEMHLETKAESKYLEVACASILAFFSCIFIYNKTIFLFLQFYKINIYP